MSGRDRTVETSYDELDVSNVKPRPECEPTEKLSAATRLMKRADENRVLITIWIAIIIYVGSQLMETRDSSMTHEIRINRIESDVTEIKSDVKSLLGRSQHNAKP